MRHVSIPTLPRRMTTRDAGFLYLERGNALLHIGCVAILDGPVHLEALARRVETRASRLRRYAQRAAFVPFSLGHPTWEDDPDFDVRQHLHRWAVPSPGGESDLAELVALQHQLDLSPIWVMPEGTSPDEVITRTGELVEPATTQGWTVTTRLQVLLWGVQRGR